MALYAEWDFTAQKAVRVKNDEDTGVISGPTGHEPSGDDTKWFPLVVELPENHVPRFPRLLGAGDMVLEDDVVHWRFPRADYSVNRVRGEVINEINTHVRHVLTMTDWAIVRKHELGVPVPEEILKQRARVRAYGTALKQRAAECSPSELLDFDPTIHLPDVPTGTLPLNPAQLRPGYEVVIR